MSTFTTKKDSVFSLLNVTLHLAVQLEEQKLQKINKLNHERSQ